MHTPSDLPALWYPVATRGASVWEFNRSAGALLLLQGHQQLLADWLY